MYGDLVDVKGGSVARVVFDSPEAYHAEQRQVFGPAISPPSSWVRTR